MREGATPISLGVSVGCTESSQTGQSQTHSMPTKCRVGKKNKTRDVHDTCGPDRPKLTVCGTSKAIWAEPPPMSRMPTVRLRVSETGPLSPATSTSTTGSSVRGKRGQLRRHESLCVIGKSSSVNRQGSLGIDGSEVATNKFEPSYKY